MPSPGTRAPTPMFGEATNSIVINEVDPNTDAVHPGCEMAGSVGVVPNTKRRISLSGKVGPKLIDPKR